MELFESNRLAQLTLVEEKNQKLIFKSHFELVRFIDDFDRIHNEFNELGINFDPEHMGSRFLLKLEDKYDSRSPVFQFYHSIQ